MLILTGMLIMVSFALRSRPVMWGAFAFNSCTMISAIVDIVLAAHYHAVGPIIISVIAFLWTLLVEWRMWVLLHDPLSFEPAEDDAAIDGPLLATQEQQQQGTQTEHQASGGAATYAVVAGQAPTNPDV